MLAARYGDVTYDANYPLKRVVDLYALNIENLNADNWYTDEKSHHDLRGHNSFIVSPNNAYIISKLTGQTNTMHDRQLVFRRRKKSS